MKRSLAIGAAIFSLAILTIQDASAQRGGGMGGGGGGARMGGGGFGGGGVRMGGPGFGGGGVRMGAPGFRGGAIRGPGVGFRGGPGVYRGVGPGIRTAAVRGGYVGGTRWAGGVRPGGCYGNAGTAIDGGDGVGASQSRRQQSALVTMPGDMDMMTAASLGMAISG